MTPNAPTITMFAETSRIRNPSRREVAEAALEGRDMTVATPMLNQRPNRHERRKAAKVNLARKDRVAP